MRCSLVNFYIYQTDCFPGLKSGGCHYDHQKKASLTTMYTSLPLFQQKPQGSAYNWK